MDADISEKLNEVLADPQKLSAVMGVVNSIMSGSEKNEPEATEEKSLQALLPKDGGKKDERVKLLLALKPFLDEERCKRVDKLVRVFSLAGIAGHFKDFI